MNLHGSAKKDVAIGVAQGLLTPITPIQSNGCDVRTNYQGDMNALGHMLASRHCDSLLGPEDEHLISVALMLNVGRNQFKGLARADMTNRDAAQKLDAKSTAKYGDPHGQSFVDKVESVWDENPTLNLREVLVLVCEKACKTNAAVNDEFGHFNEVMVGTPEGHVMAPSRPEVGANAEEKSFDAPRPGGSS